MSTTTRDLDELLTRSRSGDRLAFDELIPLLYEEMRTLAHRHRIRWESDYTLGTTDLVHEAYLRLSQKSEYEYADRAHLLAVAARAMRQILVDYYRARRTRKRGGGASRLPLESLDQVLDATSQVDPADEDTILALDQSLRRLAAESERHARIIDCRYFAGLTVEETAHALGISVASVKRGAALARAWLARDLQTLGASHAETPLSAG